MRLSDIKNEEALEVLADLIDPASKILADKEIEKLVRTGNKMNIIKYVMKKHSHEIIECLAILDREDVATYECNIISIPTKLLEIMNDPVLESFFASQVQEMVGESSGSAMVNIGE